MKPEEAVFFKVCVVHILAVQSRSTLEHVTHKFMQTLGSDKKAPTLQAVSPCLLNAPTNKPTTTRLDA